MEPEAKVFQNTTAEEVQFIQLENNSTTQSVLISIGQC